MARRGAFEQLNIRINVDGQSTSSSSGAGLFGLTAETVTSDEDGRFELRALSPGSWNISTQAGRWIPGDPQSVLIQESQTPETITLHVRLGATIRGQVIEGTTEDPLDGARIVLRSPEGDEILTTRSNEGTYLLEGVPPDDYILAVKSNNSRDPDRARREVHVGPGAPSLTVHLITLD